MMQIKYLITAFFLLGTLCIAEPPADPYQQLGLTRQVSRQEIKKTFKELSRQYHPDRGPDAPDHKQRYHRIVEAYELIKQQWN